MARLTIDAATRVAILAGGGELPLLIARSVTARGGEVHMVAIEGEADATVERFPHTWVNYGQATRMFTALRGPGKASQNVMVIAGAVKRPDIARIRPDLGLIKVLLQVLAFITAGGDDALLTKAIRVFERQGLVVVGVQDVAPELLIGEGPQAATKPSAAQRADLAVAEAVLHALGDLDVGQGAVVAGGRVLAIEGVEGTDRMLQRLRDAPAGGVLLKAPKPRQERRVDLPTIGVRTITNAAAAGIGGVAVVAGEAIGLQREAMIAAADDKAMFVIGMPPRPPETMHRPAFAVAVLSRRAPRPADQADADRGAVAVMRLAPFGAGQAAAVTRGHVLAVGGRETPLAVLQRISGFSQWGLARFRRRRGIVVVRLLTGDPPCDAVELANAIAAAGFAGLALVTTDGDLQPAPSDAVAACDAAGLSLVVMREATPPLPQL